MFQHRQLVQREVRATVRGTFTAGNDKTPGHSWYSKGSRDADMFPCSWRKPLPLWINREGAAAALVVAGMRLPLGELVRSTVDRAMVPAAVAGAVLVALLAVIKIGRRRLVCGQLARRVTYDLLPSSSFDPSPEDVARFAHQLARTRPAVAWLRPRRGASVRVRLHTNAEGRLSYQVSGPSSADSVLRHQSYAQVEVRAGTNDPGDAEQERDAAAAGVMAGDSRQVARAELVLAADAARPLRAVPLRPDLLQSFAAAVLDARPELGERAEVCIDLVPVTAGRARRLRSARSRKAQAGTGNSGGTLWRELVAEFVPSRTPARTSRDAVHDVVGKFADPLVPLFEVQVLAVTESRVPGRAQAHLHQILAAFDVMRGENWWRAAGLNLGVAHIGADSRWFRRSFDRRLATAEFAPRRANLVTAAEIGGLLKPPTKHCAHLNVARSGGMVPPAPRDLPEWTGQPGVIPVGYAPGPDGKERLLGMPLADLFFSLRVGKSRYGKTETALVQAVALALHGTDGVWFLDPHADGWRRARPLLTEPQVLARLWEIDLTVRGDDAKIAGYNPLDMTGQTAGHIEDRVDAVVTAISSALFRVMPTGLLEGLPGGRTVAP
jgi:hypothetical protein